MIFVTCTQPREIPVSDSNEPVRRQSSQAARWRSTRKRPDDHRVETTPRPAGLPPYLTAGNRVAATGLYLALIGLLCSLVPSLLALGWGTALTGEILAIVGFVKYCRLGATNRDVGIVGALVGWLALVVLLVKASIQYQLPMPWL
jgi:hypothetical protein